MKKSLLAGLQIAVLGLTFAGSATAGGAGFNGAITKGNLSVWRINSQTGQVSLCSFEGMNNKPDCYPWSEAEGDKGRYRIIAGDDVLSTWRMNGKTGEVSLCEYKDVGDPPECTPWSE